eukprot:gene14306-20287_t
MSVDSGVNVSTPQGLPSFSAYSPDCPQVGTLAGLPRDFQLASDESLIQRCVPLGMNIAPMGKTFGSGSLVGGCTSAGPFLSWVDSPGSGTRCVSNINDGLFGDNNSWIPGAPVMDRHVAGIVFDNPRLLPDTISGIAIGRDALGQFSDRVTGDVRVFVTRSSDLIRSTSVEQVLDASWVQIGVLAAGSRTAGVMLEAMNASACFDELEVFIHEDDDGGPGGRNKTFGGSCSDDSACLGKLVCRGAPLGFCVECQRDSDCSGNTRLCDNGLTGRSSSVSFLCIPNKGYGQICSFDSVCASGHCSGLGACVDCESDSDCNGSSACNSAGACKASSNGNSSIGIRRMLF